jgi:hypothetical protein
MMNRQSRRLRLSVLLLLLTLPLAGAAGYVTRPDVEELVRLGNAAFAREDFAGAVAFYERAEDRTTDPGQVAFNLATARYHLVLTGESAAGVLREAELGFFRCCKEEDNSGRRALAWLGLGNCRVLRAGGEDGSQPLDPFVLREALDAYDHCAKEASEDRLREDARHNHERVRLLLAQVLSSMADPEKSHGDDPQSSPSRTETGTQPGTEPSLGSRPDPDSKTTPAEKGAEAIKTDKGSAPGQGNLRPIPDRAEAVNLSAGEAAAQLEQAARLVLQERQAYRRSKSRGTGGGAKNW